jgi:hypothetical protein
MEYAVQEPEPPGSKQSPGKPRRASLGKGVSNLIPLALVERINQSEWESQQFL